MGKPSKSTAAALVAFVFLVLGYQLIRFAWTSAERLLQAHRDNPDTVFVIDSAPAAKLLRESGQAGGFSGTKGESESPVFRGNGTVEIRKNSAHENASKSGHFGDQKPGSKTIPFCRDVTAF